MSRNHEISEMGLKLIKAYEGYRAVDRELVTGQRVVGYGHRLSADDPSQHMSRDAAETLLRSDLAPFEDMINENVHAPLSQSQFDALCSLAYNIGPKAFLTSDTLRALNNGRPLDAASGFDIWRKSEIDGKTYVVDALMRRRTAEKALFLRTENGKAFSAPRVDLPPVEDQALALISTEDALPVFRRDDSNGIVATAPYDANPDDAPLARRAEDQPAGLMTLSEVQSEEGIWEELPEEAQPFDLSEANIVEDEVSEDQASDDDLSDSATERASTMIAEAASELSEKLDALIDDANDRSDLEDDADWPETLIKPETSKVVPFTGRSMLGANDGDQLVDAQDIFADKIQDYTEEDAPPPKADIVIDDLAADDAMRDGQNSAAKYIEIYDPEPEPKKVGWGYWMTLLLGFALLGASLAAFFAGVEGRLAGWAPLLTFAGLVIGGVLVLAALFYAIRAAIRGQ